MKKKKVPLMLVLMLLTALVVVSTAQASSIPEHPKDRPVLSAIVLMYAPMDNHADWLDAVCENMTAGGCGYFREHHAPALWQAGQDVALDNAWHAEVITTLQDGSQVWKAQVAIHKTCGSALKNCPTIESDIYLHVVHDEIQDKWLLNRALYGPYIKEQ